MIRILASLFEFVLIIAVGRLLGRVIEALRGKKNAQVDAHSRNSSAAMPPRTVEGRMARDPMCGTFVSTELSHRLDLPAGTLHFCSAGCRDRYEKAKVA